MPNTVERVNTVSYHSERFFIFDIYLDSLSLSLEPNKEMAVSSIISKEMLLSNP